MTMPSREITVELIPVEKIDVLNSRERNLKNYQEIVASIQAVGLKKPITITKRLTGTGEVRFQLVCGEGRLKAFIALGQSHIPATIQDVTEQDAFLMSLAENIARRQHRPLELLQGIEVLVKAGYEKSAIARKTMLSEEYVSGICLLLEQGEDRLLAAVHSGKIPLTIALATVKNSSGDQSIQNAMQMAYESGELRGKQLRLASRILDQRSLNGKSLRVKGKQFDRKVTPAALVRTYQRETERQQTVVRKAGLTQQRLIFVVNALQALITDENFVTLLRAEGIDTMPQYLASRIGARIAPI